MNDQQKYNPKNIESKWYQHWISKKYFQSFPDNRIPYTIVIPPPNVTGILHMGHMLNNTLQDILIRKARMEGYNACWVPGTDHASIATEAKVVNKLKEIGINKNDLSRDEFLKHAWDWKNEHGGIILEQLKKLGASCDWNRTKFTMDDSMNDSVINVFVDLHKKGLIYRGVRMINWDPKAQTALSDEEVIYKEVESKLYYINYQIEDSKEKIIIATTRPETILGDTAICINPKDKRYLHLKNKSVKIPLINRRIPIIFDEYVDMEFGTGVLKITPAHDENDYKIGIKHNLDSIDILNDDGSISKKIKEYAGIDRFKVRKQIAIDLEKNNCLVKTENYINKIGFSERTNSIIEPKLSMQWFLKMDKISKPALRHVLNNDIQLHPKKFKNTYKHWLENIKEWCISRQLWWGQRIPAYYYDGNNYVIAKNKEEAFSKIKDIKNNIKIDDIKQDEDVLDTWFSSWLWPISVFDGINNPNNKEINYYYPTNDLVTAPEILFFWVARMIIAGYEYKNEFPFKNVYLTGIVRDKEGRKMSKSLGNSPDPIKLIEKYGADGVRVGMLLCSPAGNDLPFNEQLCEQGRNFANKLWNAHRLISSWKIDDSIEESNSSKELTNWFKQKINQSINNIDESFKSYRISEALMIIYKLIWDDFCSWYLEGIKPIYGTPINSLTYKKTIDFLKDILKLLHPFMPFITEEIYSKIKCDDNADITISEWPKNCIFNINNIKDFEITKETITAIRNFRKQKNILDKESVNIHIKENKKINKNLDSIIKKLANVENINYSSEISQIGFNFMIGSNEYFIPFNEKINFKEEIKKLEKDLVYTKGFLKIVSNKLSNKKFVQNAPKELVEREDKKMIDAKNKIKILQQKIIQLKKLSK